MTDISAWLVGMVSLTAPFLLFYLGRTIWAQWAAGDMTWEDSKPTRLAASMALLIIGFSALVGAAVVSPKISSVGLATYLIWGAWSAILAAEFVALSAIGRIAPSLAVCILWTVMILAWRF